MGLEGRGGDSPYGTTSRPEVQDLVPESALRFLDVGCNDGGFGAWLTTGRSDREVWGIEQEPAQANEARLALDGRVVTGTYPQALDEIEGQFDCVSFNHVLEHKVDPWSALRVTVERLTPSGCVIAVIPNIRYGPQLADLAIRGRWDYRDSGLLDRTHLRFFTRRSTVELFEQSGFAIDVIRPVNAIGCVSHPRVSRLLARTAPNLVHSAYAVRAQSAN